MLDSPPFLGSPGGGGDGGGSSSDGVAVDLRNEIGSGDGGRNLAGNRWPREETEALLKIRFNMDQTFRDSVFKAPLWDEVSRKLSEHGYARNGKKCKEKFENIYKYHKRAKEGRSVRQTARNYRFFEQLETFDSQNLAPSTPLEQLRSYAMESATIVAQSPTLGNMIEKPVSSCQDFSVLCPTQDRGAEFTSASTSTASSSGKESEGSLKKNGKLVEYFHSLMKEVLVRQEELQKRFLEAIEKSERDRVEREERWKIQESARIKREQEYLANERAMAAAKDAAVLSFLQKLLQQNRLPAQMLETLVRLFEKPSENEGTSHKQMDIQDNGTCETLSRTVKQVHSAGENADQSSSRWPKSEVEALIMLKSDMYLKHLDSGGKGTGWEEISSRMKGLGYDRNAKRCKEKWENINKYYKRVKYSSKKRPECSKTCPYFIMLDSLYAKKPKRAEHGPGSGYHLKPEQILMQMISQQQPPPQSMGEYGHNEHNPDNYDGVDPDDDNEDCYQIVASDPSSVLLEQDALTQ